MIIRIYAHAPGHFEWMIYSRLFDMGLFYCYCFIVTFALRAAVEIINFGPLSVPLFLRIAASVSPRCVF